MAVWALACIGPEGPDAVPVLVGALESEDFSTRANACMALEHIGSAAAPALEALEKAGASNGDPEFKAEIARALEAIGRGLQVQSPRAIARTHDKAVLKAA